MHCRIRINGHLGSSWREWFELLEIVQEETGTTLLCGQLEDQAALYSVLLKIRNLGLVLVALETGTSLPTGKNEEYISMNTSQSLTSKVAVITGSARNMGRAFAEALARNRADIVVHYHSAASQSDAEETVRLVKAQGTRALAVDGDLADPAAVKRLFDETFNAFGRVDIVINNAGLVIKKPFVEIIEADFDRSFGINAKAAFFVMQEAARRISDHGRIINMGTTILGATIPFYSVYAGAKAALEDFTRSLAREIGHRGVTVNTVAPGPVDDVFYHGAETPESVARATQASVAGRLGHVEDIVPLIEFLASPESQWITAQTLFINGGYLAR